MEDDRRIALQGMLERCKADAQADLSVPRYSWLRDDEIETALKQIKRETLAKVTECLKSLDQDEYGNCSDCGHEISESRLRGLPFARRCKDCDETKGIKNVQEDLRAQADAQTRFILN